MNRKYGTRKDPTERIKEYSEEYKRMTEEIKQCEGITRIRERRKKLIISKIVKRVDYV